MNRLARSAVRGYFEEHEVFLQIDTTSERPCLNRNEYSVTTEKPLNEVPAAPPTEAVLSDTQHPQTLFGDQESEQYAERSVREGTGARPGGRMRNTDPQLVCFSRGA